ncbi:hypothetical protein F4808DRAFT_431291 [Astrocystis sublimbata]|nr:hypothetical protein F4808DRAFT_431291 [Astrocystis sublimbata]
MHSRVRPAGLLWIQGCAPTAAMLPHQHGCGCEVPFGTLGFLPNELSNQWQCCFEWLVSASGDGQSIPSKRAGYQHNRQTCVVCQPRVPK